MLHTGPMDLEELQDNFALLEDWDERYGYLIELGKKLPPMSDELKTDSTKVQGCMSQVWLVGTFKGGTFDLIADSDGLIVRGLIAVLRVLFVGKTPAEVGQSDPRPLFQSMGLEGHISPGRSNGLWSMVKRIKEIADANLTA